MLQTPARAGKFRGSVSPHRADRLYRSVLRPLGCAPYAENVELEVIPGGTGTVVRMPDGRLRDTAGGSLPWLLAASSAASVSALLHLTAADPRERRTAERFGLLVQAAELAAAALVERDARRVPRGTRVPRHGLSGALWNAAWLCTAGALVLGALPGTSRPKRLGAAALGLAGSACARVSVYCGDRRAPAL